MARFKENYARLSDRVKKRLVLENDDMCWSVEDLLPTCQEFGIPLVLVRFTAIHSNRRIGIIITLFLDRCVKVVILNTVLNNRHPRYSQIRARHNSIMERQKHHPETTLLRTPQPLRHNPTRSPSPFKTCLQSPSLRSNDGPNDRSKR